MNFWHFSYLNHIDLIIFITLILLMNCVEFCMKQVFKWTKAQAWVCPLDTPRNIQEVQASKLGDSRGTPSSLIKSTRSFFSALYFYCFMRYVLFLERLYFLCVFLLFFFLFNKFGPIMFCFVERHAPQSLYRTL